MGSEMCIRDRSCAPLLAAGIRSVFEEGSVAILLDGLPEDMRPRNIYA